MTAKSTGNGTAPQAYGASTMQSDLQPEYTPETAVLTISGLRALGQRSAGTYITGDKIELLSLCVAAELLDMTCDELFQKPPFQPVSIDGVLRYRLFDVRRHIAATGCHDRDLR